MVGSFFSKPKTADDWFRVPAVIGGALAVLLALAAVLVGIPATLVITAIGGGTERMLLLLAAIVFPAPAWLAFKALTRGDMRRACWWSLVPLVSIGVAWVTLGGVT